MSSTKKMEPVDAHAPTEELEVGAKKALMIGVGVGAVLVVGAIVFVGSTVHAAGNRLAHPEEAKAAPVAVANEAEVGYCTPAFKQVLQRVLNACGLVGSEQRRGCQPADVKTFAQITGLKLDVDPSVTGKITVEFHETPWDKALMDIAKQNGLTVTVRGDTIHVARK